MTAVLATAGAAGGTATAGPGERVAAPPPGPRAAGAAAPAAKVVKSADVTLVTGDRFRVDVAEDGSQQVAPLDAVGENGGTFTQFTYDGDAYVIPAKAAPFLGTTLDPRLFDVGYLVRAKLDDGHASSLPVTVRATSAKADGLPGTSVTSSSGGTVRAKVAKRKAAGFGALLARNWEAARGGGGSATPGLSGVDQMTLAVPGGAPKLPAAPPLVRTAAPKATVNGGANGPANSPVNGAAKGGVRYRTLTVDSIDQDGKPGVMIGFVHSVDDATLGDFGMAAPGNGRRAFSVPEGTYSIEASVLTGPGTDRSSRAALVIEPELTVKGDTTVVLDARKAVQYRTDLAAPPKPDMPRVDFMAFLRGDTHGKQEGVPPNGVGSLAGFYDMRLGSSIYNGNPKLYVTPTKPVTKGTLHFLETTSLSTGTGSVIGSGPTYKTLFLSEGSVPAVQTHSLAQSDFATVESRLHNVPSDDASTGPAQWYTNAFLPWTYTSVGHAGAVPAGDRTDYLYSNTPDQVVWEWAFTPDKGGRRNDPRRTLKPGQVVRQEFGGAPPTPSVAAEYLKSVDVVIGGGDHAPTTDDALAQVCVACRQGDLAALFLRGGADTDPTHHAYVNGEGNEMRFYRDGKLAYSTEVEPSNIRYSPDPANLPLAPRPADYRLVWESSDPDVPDATGTTDWRFRSAPGGATATLPKTAFCGLDTSTSCSFLPLLFVTYDLKLDADSRAKAGQPFDVGFRVSHQQYQAAPTGVTGTVEVSYDDGATWSGPSAATAGSDGVFHASVTHPAYDRDHRWVSLRVTAHDADGSSVTQTNVHAYRLDG
ncbi:hypothetical protein [Actinomadura harenae]|uniref:Uncharacterized protein n=1 Tax=Actinomadura harenae TaxID=2483351 RepID=A0A3M2LSF5_9ACTN|nr:hypothetical protein [Actinomadura harenae]RMI39513.1 hypothetical protein EBO15_29580 [Actinomadura harenae]